MDAGEVDKAFRDWTVATANDEELLEMLRHLCGEGIDNDRIRHRQLLRGITINHIQMSRTIRVLEKTLCTLNAANERTQRLVIKLAIIAIAVGIAQVIAAFCR